MNFQAFATTVHSPHSAWHQKHGIFRCWAGLHPTIEDKELAQCSAEQHCIFALFCCIATTIAPFFCAQMISDSLPFRKMSLAATASAPEALKVLLPEALQGDQAGPLNSVLKPCTSVNSSNFFLRPMTGALVHPFSGSGKRAASMQTRIFQHGRQCKVSVLDSATFFSAAFSCLLLQSLFVIPIFCLLPATKGTSSWQ